MFFFIKAKKKKKKWHDEGILKEKKGVYLGRWRLKKNF